MFNLWFETHPVKYQNLSDIQSTFMQGGFYKYVYGDYIFIALNSLYFYTGTETENHDGIDVLQMNFLEQTILQNPTKRFIINFHFYPGTYWFKKSINDWD